MNGSSDKPLASFLPILLLTVLAVSFWFDVWNRPVFLNPVLAVDSMHADPATVRLSATELYRTDGDVSMLSCYACHEQDLPPVLTFDEDGRVVAEEHQLDFDLRHGARHQNENCFTCHDQNNLERLKMPDGRLLMLTEGNTHCGGCHGTNHRDWEIGIHGRVSGFWNRDLGPSKQEDCTSCHDPHSPAFPSIEPAPGPQALRVQAMGHKGAPDESPIEVSDELAEGH